MKTNGREEPFIPLDDPSGQNLIPVGDPQGSKGWARVQSAKEARNDPRRANEEGLRIPSGGEIAWHIDYDLLLASEREARRQLLAPWAMIPPDVLKKLGPEKFVDPYVSRELHLQELRDKELRDVLDALFGKAGDWRVGLCIESRRNDYARGELNRIMGGAAARGEVDEVARFLEAFRAVDRLKKGHPLKIAKALALLFTLGCRVCGDPLPTKGEVLRFVQPRLASGGIDSRKRNAWRDIFTGPILSALLRGHAGRPRKARRARK
jgi:hypothetical protein